MILAHTVSRFQWTVVIAYASQGGLALDVIVNVLIMVQS